MVAVMNQSELANMSVVPPPEPTACPASAAPDLPCLMLRGDVRPWDIADRECGQAECAERLPHVVRRLTESFDVSELAHRITESMLPLFGARTATAWLLQPGDSLACVAGAGPRPEHLKIGCVLPRGVGAAGRAVAERRALWGADMVEGLGIERAGALRGDASAADHRGVLAVPLIVKAEAIGAIVISDLERRAVDQAEVDRVEAFADLVALALRNVQLFEREQVARAETDAATRDNAELFAVLAHEFRNSLAPIVTAAAVIRHASPPLGIVQESAAVVERQGWHLARLLEDLLDASRIARGGLKLERASVSVAVALEEAVGATRSLADKAGLNVSLSLPPVAFTIDADPTRLAQVFLNLLHNAVKYTPPGGRIEVAGAADKGDVVVRVKDTGIGIAPEMLPHVFEYFVRGDQARVHAANGLGVGLALVRQLVELHGGQVAAHSEGPGRGSEFTVRLPLSVGAEPPGPAAHGEKPRRVESAGSTAKAHGWGISG
jgi:signal transduction histidine kinase